MDRVLVVNINQNKALVVSDTSSYPLSAGWLYDPDISQVQNIDIKYWKVENDQIVEMTEFEKDVIDQNIIQEKESALTSSEYPNALFAYNIGNDQTVDKTTGEYTVQFNTDFHSESQYDIINQTDFVLKELGSYEIEYFLNLEYVSNNPNTTVISYIENITNSNTSYEIENSRSYGKFIDKEIIRLHYKFLYQCTNNNKLRLHIKKLQGNATYKVLSNGSSLNIRKI